LLNIPEQQDKNNKRLDSNKAAFQEDGISQEKSFIDKGGPNK